MPMNALASALTATVLTAAAVASAHAQAPFSLQYSLTLYEGLDYRGASVTFYGDNANIGSTGFANRARSAQVRGVWRLCEGGGYRNHCEVLSANVRDLDAYGLAGRVGSAQNLSFAGASAAPPPVAPPSRYAPPVGAYTPQPYTPPSQPYAPPARPYTAPAQAYAPAPEPYAAPQTYARPAQPPAEPTYVAPYTAAPPYGAGAYDPDAYAPPALDAPLPAPGPLTRGLRTQPPPPVPSAAPPAYAPGTFGDEPAQGSATVYFPQPLIYGADVSAASARAADGFCRRQGLGAAVYFDQTQRAPRAVDLQGRPVGEGPVLRDVLCRRY
jgi:hypothetical protein